MTRNFGSIGSAILAAALLLGTILFAGGPAAAQGLIGLRGSVADPSGSPIPNATVHLINNATNADRTTTTDTRGAYSFDTVPNGTYHVMVEAPGFERFDQTDLRLQTTVPTTLDIKMKIVEVQANVTVTGSSTDHCLVAQSRVFPDVAAGLRVVRRGPNGNYYVLTAPGAAAFIYSRDGKKIGQVPAAASARVPDAAIIFGSDLQFDAMGRVYIADRAANTVKIYGTNGVLLGKFRVAAPISVEPAADGGVAVASLTSQHLVDVYDPAKGVAYRSFGDVRQPTPAECDAVTLRCTVHAITGQVGDASHLQDRQTPMNRAWFAGDFNGNVFINIADSPAPTIRKYNADGYLEYESPFDVSQLNPDANVPPSGGKLGAGLLHGVDNATLTNPATDTTGSTDLTLTGGRPTMSGANLPGGSGGGLPGNATNLNLTSYRLNFNQAAKSTAIKPVIDALAVDPSNEDVWATIAGSLVHFDQDGKFAGSYCLSTGDKSPIKPVAILVEPDRILLGIDPFGIFQYARPDKPAPIQ